MTRRIMVAGLMMLTLGSVAGSAETAAKPAASNPQFERMKALAGTWVKADKAGKPTDEVVSIIRVTAGGSAVHETLFPGQPMEMISVYHLDGADLLMTHYCALGNQPRVKADPASPADRIEFKFVGGTNLDVNKDMHMHDATLIFHDADHIEMAGTPWANGKPADNHCGEMKLVRKK